jgi:hypothetical protein
MTRLRFLARLLVVAALLAAQHTALSHELWHAGESGDKPKHEQLCDFHAALGSVLGAIGGSGTASEPPSPCDVPMEADRTAAASRSGLTPSSRDPPGLL